MGAQRRIRRRKNRQSLSGDNRRVAFAPWTWTSIRPKQNGYDAKYRLNNGNFSAPASVNYTYTYDDVDNRTFSGEPAAATFTYNAFGQITTSISAGVVSTYTYDLNGNLNVVNTGGTFTTMSYDKENRMTVSQTNAARTTYTYFGDGLKRSENSGSGVTTLVWDGSDYVGEITSGSFSKRIQTIDNHIFSVEGNSGDRLDHVGDRKDQLFSLVNQAEEKISDSRYAPYGEFLPNSTAMSPWAWLGGWGYRMTGLTVATHYIRARHFGQRTGNWTSVDPLWPEEPAYGYVYGAVTYFADPSGLKNGATAPNLNYGSGSAPRLVVVQGGAGRSRAGNGSSPSGTLGGPPFEDQGIPGKWPSGGQKTSPSCREIIVPTGEPFPVGWSEAGVTYRYPNLFDYLECQELNKSYHRGCDGPGPVRQCNPNMTGPVDCDGLATGIINFGLDCIADRLRILECDRIKPPGWILPKNNGHLGEMCNALARARNCLALYRKRCSNPGKIPPTIDRWFDVLKKRCEMGGKWNGKY